jgi:VCBS repeat-containing protein
VDAENGVLANDFDLDGDLLTAQALGGAAHGILTLYADGSFVYIPDTDYAGADYFTYQASDGLYLSKPVMVTINVTSEGNTKPIAVADTYSTEVNTTLDVDAEHGVLANDYDADGDVLIAQALGGASHGILTLHEDGSFVYIPNTDFIGADYFTYQAFDGMYTSKPVMVTINVTGEDNSQPVAVADTFTAYANLLLVVNAASGVLANDTDADGDTLSALLLGGASHGTISLHVDGSFEYMPDLNYAGADYFTYQVSDGLELSTPVMVTINVVEGHVLSFIPLVTK